VVVRKVLRLSSVVCACLSILALLKHEDCVL